MDSEKQNQTGFRGLPQGNPFAPQNSGLAGQLQLPSNPFWKPSLENPIDRIFMEPVEAFKRYGATIVNGLVSEAVKDQKPVGSGVQVGLQPNAQAHDVGDYEITRVTVDNRPFMLIKNKSNGNAYLQPVGDNLQGFVQSIWGTLPGMPQRQPQAGTPSQPAPSAQQQQQSMNIFEYMSKLPPQERMMFTLLLYLLISDTLGRMFQRGGGRQQPPIAYAQSPWMPGPPKGQQWMIWG